MAVERNWVHRSKHVPWGAGTGAGDVIILGADLTGAAFVWAFALTSAGSPVITLTDAAAGVQGVSKAYDANYVDPETGAVVGATAITPHITEATLEALTYSGSDPLTLYGDLLMTPSGGAQRVVIYGTLTVHQGMGD